MRWAVYDQQGDWQGRYDTKREALATARRWTLVFNEPYTVGRWVE